MESLPRHSRSSSTGSVPGKLGCWLLACLAAMLFGGAAQAQTLPPGTRAPRAWLQSPTAYLLDPAGTVGRAYRARTTPHMFIINGEGTVPYAGGIDDKPTADPEDIGGARNHVLAALAELKAGQPVSTASSRPYGCSVKYADS